MERKEIENELDCVSNRPRGHSRGWFDNRLFIHKLHDASTFAVIV